MAFVIAEHESSGTAIKGTRVGKLIISILIFLGQIQSNSLPPFFLIIAFINIMNCRSHINVFEVICVSTYLSCQTWTIVTFWLWRIIQDFLTWTTLASSVRLYKYVLLNRINNIQYFNVKGIFYLLFQYFRFWVHQKMYRFYLKCFFLLWLAVWLVKDFNLYENIRYLTQIYCKWWFFCQLFCYKFCYILSYSRKTCKRIQI